MIYIQLISKARNTTTLGRKWEGDCLPLLHLRGSALETWSQVSTRKPGYQFPVRGFAFEMLKSFLTQTLLCLATQSRISLLPYLLSTLLLECKCSHSDSLHQEIELNRRDEENSGNNRSSPTLGTATVHEIPSAKTKDSVCPLTQSTVFSSRSAPWAVPAEDRPCQFNRNI